MAEELVTVVNGKRRRTRVDVVAMDAQGNVLSFYRGLNKLPELPGGGVDVGETILQAGLRELMEEAGWTSISATRFIPTRHFIFEGRDSAWFTSRGWDQEINHAVMVQLDRFAPDKRYQSEGDALAFELIPLEQLKAQTMAAIRHGIDGRRLTFALLRMEVINYLLGLTDRVFTQSTESLTPPRWCQW